MRYFTVMMILVALFVMTVACSSNSESDVDSDGDGWSDEQEKVLGTNPYQKDSDQDGIIDPEDPNPLIVAEAIEEPSFTSSPVSTPTPLSTMPPKTSPRLTPTPVKIAPPTPTPTPVPTTTYYPPTPSPITLPSPTQAVAMVEQPPESPSSLSGEAVSQTNVYLNWCDNANDEDGFRVYRNGTVVGSVRANAETYQDKDLEAATTYQYAVKAYNDGGESNASVCTISTKNPPLNVTIDYIGVKLDHDPTNWIQGAGDIKLMVLITDGEQSFEEILPGAGQSYSMNDYETKQIGERVFHTAAAGDNLKISIIAYEDDPQISAIISSALTVLGPIVGVPYVGDISSFLTTYESVAGKPLFENDDDYVGYYDNYWGSDESWGIGQHNAVGKDDFRVWLSIWSDREPAPVSPQPTLLPDVSIQTIDIPEKVEVGKEYIYYATLRNGESHSLEVTLTSSSSAHPETVYRKDGIVIPANSKKRVEVDRVRFEPAGVRTMTYALLHRNREIDSVSKTVDASEFNVGFDGWYVNGIKVSSAPKDQRITARVSLLGGEPANYEIRIRRDIDWGFDEDIAEYPFYYDGTSTVEELSFYPPYATGENSTNGYFVKLLKNGSEVWTLNTRLTVAAVPSPTPTPTPQPTSGPPTCGFYGSVTISGNSVSDGTVITAWINGIEVASATTVGSSYNLQITGNYTNKTVSFKIGCDWAGETSLWEAMSNKSVKLTTVGGPQVCGFFGSVTLDGIPVMDGTLVSAWIENVEVASVTTTGSSYNIQINGEGQCFSGKTVIFKIGSNQAAESATWYRASNTTLNLTG